MSKNPTRIRLVDSDDSKTLCYIEGNFTFLAIKKIVKELVDRDNKCKNVEGRNLFQLMQKINEHGFKAIFINVNEVMF